ncbi:MAG: exo-alpha-sialidase [bacterium]|nr:exo-alpha-sialidase [bacterium]
MRTISLFIAAAMLLARPAICVDRPGPWDNDVIVYRVVERGVPEKLAAFERAGVPTAARLADGRLIAAHQHFPADDPAGFDKVAVRFSADEGTNWTAPRVIGVEGLAEGMRFPFDPTLAPLPDGRVRLYFTSVDRRAGGAARPAIYSAISSDGLAYRIEPGVRFGVEGRPVIDCAVAIHQGVFHLYAPDNGVDGPPGVPMGMAPGGRRPGPAAGGPREGVGYHATSSDGLTFTRVDDVRIEGRRRWLGNALSAGGAIMFFGTGDPGVPGGPNPAFGPPRAPGGVWRAASIDGARWTVDDAFPAVPGADPGAVQLRDGSWLLIVTGPPRPGTPSARRPAPPPR